MLAFQSDFNDCINILVYSFAEYLDDFERPDSCQWLNYVNA